MLFFLDIWLQVIINVLICFPADFIIYLISGYISIHLLFSLLWLIFFCFITCLFIIDIYNIMNFTTLVTGYFCILIHSLSFFYHTLITCLNSYLVCLIILRLPFKLLSMTSIVLSSWADFITLLRQYSFKLSSMPSALWSFFLPLGAGTVSLLPQFSDPFKALFSWPGVISSLCAEQYSPKYSRGMLSRSS